MHWLKSEVLRLLWRLGLYTPPDRIVLERDILPALARDRSIARVLFVGVEWYTARYPDLFTDKTFATIDPNPNVASLGGHPHVVGRVQEVETHFPGTIFDAIVMTGVIGYGLDDSAEVERALRACAKALRSGGWLVLGVDELRPTHVDPGTCPARHNFEPCAFGQYVSGRADVAIPFKERRHTFLFWRKK